MANPRSTTRIRPMNVVVAPGTAADATFRKHREAHAAAIEPGFPPLSQLDMHNFGGKTIRDLNYANFFVGDPDAWNPTDVQNIDADLRAAMTDTNLNNVLAQYFDGDVPTTTAMPRRTLSEKVPTDVFKDTIEGIVGRLHSGGSLNDIELQSTLLNFMLPPGTVLHSGSSTGAADEDDDRGRRLDDEEADSNHGLGGYHGSIHPTDSMSVYYAVGVFSEMNGNAEIGIVAFDQPWKNVVATFYHELQEARTDPDVGDAAHSGDEHFLGWYSLFKDFGGEIGDIPINETGGLGKPLSSVFQEVELTDGSGTVPIQLMYSNMDHGPAGPTSQPTTPGPN
jgi:hypothetical protein